MAFGKKNELVVTAKEAEKKRDSALGELERECKRHMNARKEAEQLIQSLLDFFNSIKRTPMKLKGEVKSIAREKQDFKKSNEIIKRQFARDSIGIGVAVIGVGGVAAFAWKMKDQLRNFFSQSKIGMVIIFHVAVLAAGIVTKIVGLFKKASAKEWAEFAESCNKVTVEAKTKELASREARERVEKATKGLNRQFELAESLRGSSFSKLRDDQKGQLVALVRNTLAMAQDLNLKVER